jgi:endonuclease G
MDAVLTVVELDLGRGVSRGWGHNSSSSVKTSAAKSNENKSKKTPGFSCGGKAPAIIMIIVTFITSVVIVSLAIAGQGISNFGCSSIRVECSLGTDRRQTVVVSQVQSWSLATGCKFDADSKNILAKCLVALAPGTGYGFGDIVSSSMDGNTSYGEDYNYSTKTLTQNAQRTQLVSSGTDANYTETQVQEAAAGKSLSKGGLNVDAIKLVLNWNNVVYSSTSLRSELEQLLSSLLAEINGAQSAAEAWDSTTDPSLRSFQELLVDGSEADVALEARYENWRGEEEVMVTRVAWAQIAAITDAQPANIVDIDEIQDAAGDETGRRLMVISSDAGPELRGDISFHHRARGESHGLVDYKLKVKIGSKKSAGTSNTITVQLHGSQGRTSGYATLGDAWEAGTERTVVLAGMKEVGAVVQVTLTTSGKDGVDFEEIWVTHTEDPNTAASTVTASNSGIDTDARSSPSARIGVSESMAQSIDVGSLVTIGSGKYNGCQGNVVKFSANTGKPQVCRDCAMTTPSGIDCCGSSRCGYYGTDQVELKQAAGVLSSSDSSSTSSSSAMVASDPERLRKGHSVRMLTGKYEGCTGTVIKFSAATSRPQVCRNCDQVGDDGQSCCGSTERSKCSYTSADNVECLACKAGTASAKATSASAKKMPLVEHSSFFTMESYLKCSGSKRKGTWSCSETLDATIAPDETSSDGPGTSDPTTSSSKCAKPGDADWQGNARVIKSTFDDASLIGPLEYSFGNLWVDPLARGASRFQYTARRDCGSLNRHGSFKVDREHKEIQQTTGRTYPKYCVAPQRGGRPWSLDGLNSREIKDQCSKHVGYDRGHLVPANHFDHDKKIIAETNLMINILPQASKMNRGAWLETEMITECLREEEVLTVVGGAVYPESPKETTESEFFRKTHGVVTPTHFWKIIAGKPDGRYAADNGLIAFWMPNSDVAAASRTSEYVVSISELEENLAQAGFRGGGKGWPSRTAAEIFDLPQSVKDHVPSFWGTLEGCDRS